MRVKNIHEREMPASMDEVGGLIDILATPNDSLWPYEVWSAMKFKQGLQVGAKGGHGQIRYSIEAYEPGRRIHFCFTSPKGFDGFHSFEVDGDDKGRVILRHVLKMNAMGAAMLSWALVFRPLHDALIEDAMDKAEKSLGGHPSLQEWSSWVKVLRWLFRKIGPKRS